MNLNEYLSETANTNIKHFPIVTKKTHKITNVIWANTRIHHHRVYLLSIHETKATSNYNSSSNSNDDSTSSSSWTKIWKTLTTDTLFCCLNWEINMRAGTDWMCCVVWFGLVGVKNLRWTQCTRGNNRVRVVVVCHQHIVHVYVFIFCFFFTLFY